MELDAAKKPAASDCVPDASEAEAAAAPTGNGRKKKRTLDELIAGLPVTEVLIDPEEAKAEPEAWSCIGAEETKLIDYTPGRFLCQKLVRRKYVRKAARHLPPVTAPLHTLQDRCIATPRLLAHTAASHFELHLPYYRIAQMYARRGMPIERQTLGGWMGMAHEASGLIIEQIKQEVFADGYVQGDETPVKYQDPGTRRRVRHRLPVGVPQPGAQRQPVRMAHQPSHGQPGEHRAAGLQRHHPVRRLSGV
ncbi:MAG: transposase [Prosthecobacter sp.]|uniref:IS66 family transposase n=1 Tax=Prosthecobacter sp. TaxID=1965333 RepID=UPI003BB1A547